MRDDASNLHFVAFGLKILDQRDRTITVAERRVEDEVPTTLDCSRTQFFRPVTGVLVGVPGPSIRVPLIQSL
jgi:hypothetical protein